MGNKIRALFTFEIMGRPAEHVKTTMEELIDKLAELPGISIDRREVHEPKPVEHENAKDLFTTFSEVEILGDEIDNLVTIVFHAMPSHIEIIEPEEFGLRNFDVSTLLTSLTTKLHRYDEIAKAIALERNILAQKLEDLQKKLNAANGSDAANAGTTIVKEVVPVKKDPEKKEKPQKEKKKIAKIKRTEKKNSSKTKKK